MAARRRVKEKPGLIRRALARVADAGRQKPRPAAYWLRRCQALIVKHSGPAHTTGPFKGHSFTDAPAWVAELAAEVQADILRRRGPAERYDENMALAAELGCVLVAWYATVHRAKTYDPNRPLKLRRRAAAQLLDRKAWLTWALSSDELLGEVFGKQQSINFPYGKDARGGKFR